MALPAEGAFSPFAASALNLFYEQYNPVFWEQVWYGDDGLARIMQPEDSPITGDGKNYTVERGGTDTTRFNTDLLAQPTTGRELDSDRIKFRANAQTSSENDFVRLLSRVRFSDLDLRGVTTGGTAAIINLVQRSMQEAMAGFKFKRDCAMRLRRSGLVAQQAGTKKNNDAPNMTDATTYTAGSTSARLYVDNGSVGMFKNNWLYDAYDSSSGALLVEKMAVTDINVGDTTDGTSTGLASIGFTVVGTGGTANMNGLTDNANLYFTGARNMNPYSPEEWMTYPSTGAAFIGGRDRLASGSRWLLPQFSRHGASSTQINRTIFDTTMDQSVNLTPEQKMPRVACMEQLLHSSLRQQIGDQAFTVLPASDNATSRDGTFGITGLNYLHPYFGRIILHSDVYAKPNRIEIYRPEDWMMVYYGSKEPYPVPGTYGPFSRVPGATYGDGNSLFWEADSYAIIGWMCTAPARQIVIENVNP